MSTDEASPGRTRRLVRAMRGGPLASSAFRLLSVGQLTSTIGDYCYAVALPWLILSTHGGPVLLGTVLACYGIPRTVLVPIGGLLADRVGPRLVMLAADTGRCACVAVLVLLAAKRVDSLALLGPVAAVLGAGEGVFLPASFSIMPAILDPGQLQAGNALSSAMVQVGSLAGPVLGGVIVTTAGPAPAFAVDAASFAVSAAALAMIRTRRADDVRPAAPEHATAAAGVVGPAADQPASAATVRSLLLHSRLLQVILTVSVAANFAFGGTLEVALPALAHASFGANGYGAVIACFGAGSIAGTLTAGRSAGLARPALIAAFGFLLEGLAFCLVPFLGGLPGAAAAILVVGICNGFGNIVLVTLLQRWAPAELLGRVMSLIMLAGIGAFPASVALSGVLVRHLGPSPFFPVAGGVLVVSVLGALIAREFRQFGASPAGGRADQASAAPAPAPGSTGQARHPCGDP